MAEIEVALPPREEGTTSPSTPPSSASCSNGSPQKSPGERVGTGKFRILSFSKSQPRAASLSELQDDLSRQEATFDPALQSYESTIKEIESVLQAKAVPSIVEIDGKIFEVTEFVTFRWSVANLAEVQKELKKFRTTAKTTVASPIFEAGGHSWRMILHPNGHGDGAKTHLSLFLELCADDDEPVKAAAFVGFVLKNQTALGGHLKEDFLRGSPRGFDKIIPIKDVFEGAFLRDGALEMKCRIKVYNPVPPSSLSSWHRQSTELEKRVAPLLSSSLPAPLRQELKDLPLFARQLVRTHRLMGILVPSSEELAALNTAASNFCGLIEQFLPHNAQEIATHCIAKMLQIFRIYRLRFVEQIHDEQQAVLDAISALRATTPSSAKRPPPSPLGEAAPTAAKKQRTHQDRPAAGATEASSNNLSSLIVSLNATLQNIELRLTSDRRHFVAEEERFRNSRGAIYEQPLHRFLELLPMPASPLCQLGEEESAATERIRGAFGAIAELLDERGQRLEAGLQKITSQIEYIHEVQQFFASQLDNIQGNIEEVFEITERWLTDTRQLHQRVVQLLCTLLHRLQEQIFHVISFDVKDRQQMQQNLDELQRVRILDRISALENDILDRETKISAQWRLYGLISLLLNQLQVPGPEDPAPLPSLSADTEAVVKEVTNKQAEQTQLAITMLQESEEWEPILSSSRAAAPAFQNIGALAAALQCPLTREIIREPFTIEDHHTYEKEAIQLWLRLSESSALISPVSGQRLRSSEGKQNLMLANILAAFRELHPGDSDPSLPDNSP